MRPNRFVNRAADLRQLDRLLHEPDRRVGASPVAGLSAVAGAPGVGKTALALHWAHRVRDRFRDGDLYVDLQGYGPGAPITAAQALERFLRALGTSPDSIPDDLEDRAALFRSTLDEKHVLLVIDNASDSMQVRHLIPASAHCFTIVTSRSALPGLVTREGAARMTLDVLSPAESVDLLAEFITPEAMTSAPAAAFRLAEFCGYLPLTLRIVGERASSRPRTSLEELLAELVAEKHRLDALASAEDELSDTRAVFSWSYRALDAELRRAFRLISLHHGPDISIDAAAALIGADVATARRWLRSLTGVHLVQEPFNDRFRVHDLLQAYAGERASIEDSQHDRVQAIRRVLLWYLLIADQGRQAILPHSAAVPLPPSPGIELRISFDSGATAISWFEKERTNILSALHQATEFGQFDLAWKLAAIGSGFFELRSYWGDWETTMKTGLRAARALGDPLGEAVSLLLLADAHWQVGRLAEAAASYQQAARIAYDISAGWIEGFATRGLGLLLQESGQPDGAREMFSKALRIFERDGHQRGAGMSLLSLGKCAAANDLVQAVRFHTRALTIFQDIGDRWTIAWGKLALGRTLRQDRRPLEAVTHLHQAAEVFADFADHRCAADALVELGDAWHDSARPAEADRCWARAADILQSLDDPRHRDIRQRLSRSDTEGE